MPSIFAPTALLCLTPMLINISLYIVYVFLMAEYPFFLSLSP
jgi:hypothetical protein